MFDFEEIEENQAKFEASRRAAEEAAAARGDVFPAQVWTPWVESQPAETVTVWLDPSSPDLAITLEVPEEGATIGWVKRELCRQDLNGELVLDQIQLGAEHLRSGVSTVPSTALPLEDDVVLTAALRDLVILDEDRLRQLAREMRRKAKAEEEAEARAEAQARAEAEARAEAQARAEAEARAEAKARAEAEARAEAKAKAEAEARAEAEATAEAEARAAEERRRRREAATSNSEESAGVSRPSDAGGSAGQPAQEQSAPAASGSQAGAPDGGGGDSGGTGVGRKEAVGGQRPAEQAASSGSSPSIGGASPASASDRLAELDKAVARAEEAGGQDAIVAALLDRAEFRRQRGEPEEALPDAEHCVTLTAYTDARSLYVLGKARLEVGGRAKEALADIRRARRLDPSLPGYNAWIMRGEYWVGLRPRANHYKTLGLPADATADSIRKAHRKMALVWHPDKPGGDAAKFRAIQEAWEVLGDEKKKATYDFGGRKPAPDLPQPKNTPRPPKRNTWADYDASKMPEGAAPPPEMEVRDENGKKVFHGHFEFQGTGVFFFNNSDDLRKPYIDQMNKFMEGLRGPTWTWTHSGVREYAEHAEAFGNPKADDIFTEAHSETIKAILGLEYGGYEKLCFDGTIRRNSGNGKSGKDHNSLDPPPGGYKTTPGNSTWVGMAPWPGLFRNTINGGGPGMGGGKGAGPGKGSPLVQPPTQSPHSPWGHAAGKKVRVGDGVNTCLHCGFVATTSREKGLHDRETGHMGFFLGGS